MRLVDLQFICSQTYDKHDPSGFFVEHAAWPGDVSVAMSVHDIDLMLWFFCDDIIPKSVLAHGVCAVQPDLGKYNDYENAVGIVEFRGWQDGLLLLLSSDGPRAGGYSRIYRHWG